MVLKGYTNLCGYDNSSWHYSTQVREVGVEIRPAVEAFAKVMEAKLALHEDRGGWGVGTTNGYLEKRLWDELREYTQEGEPEELVDIANFCMMLWTRIVGLGKAYLE